jgi:hypothetical protein
MDLVDEKNRPYAALAETFSRAHDRFTNVFHPARHGGQAFHLVPRGEGQDACQGRLARAGRAPEDH